MQSVFSRGRRIAAAWLLILVLLAPTAFAAADARNSSLWTEFMVWLQAQFDVPASVTPADVRFTVWLMGRLNIPPG